MSECDNTKTIYHLLGSINFLIVIIFMLINVLIFVLRRNTEGDMSRNIGVRPCVCLAYVTFDFNVDTTPRKLLYRFCSNFITLLATIWKWSNYATNFTRAMGFVEFVHSTLWEHYIDATLRKPIDEFCSNFVGIHIAPGFWFYKCYNWLALRIFDGGHMATSSNLVKHFFW